MERYIIDEHFLFVDQSGTYQGAVREVFEECGIKSTFKSLLLFRHSHGFTFGKSDLYVICRLEPLPGYETQDAIVPCAEEVQECVWLPIREVFSENRQECFKAF